MTNLKILITIAGLSLMQYLHAANSDGFILITSLYNEKNEARVREYLTCLHQNLEHPMIKKIHVFYDVAKDSAQPQENIILQVLEVFKQKNENHLSITPMRGYPTFELCFFLANTTYKGENIIIANGDIFFNSTLDALKGYDLTNRFLALTRWDLTKDFHLSFLQWINSQDAWIFKSPIQLFEKSSYALGTLQCDNHIAYQAQKAGLIVSNPSLTIQACHYHLSEVRNYSNERPSDPMLSIMYTTLR